MLDKIENVLIGVNLTLGLTQFKTILGIILLSIQIVLILIKCAIKVYAKIKAKKVNDAIKDIEEAQKEIENIKEANKNE